MATSLQPSSLHPSDLGRTATVGLRTRKLRTALSALGIMIGIAAMVGVLGLSESSIRLPEKPCSAVFFLPLAATSFYLLDYT